MWKQTIEKTGQRIINFFEAVYEIFWLFLNALKSLSRFWFYRRQVFDQFYIFLVKTLPIAAVIAVFIGLGCMIQGTYQSSVLVPHTLTMNVIFKSIMFEITPIVLGLVLAGKLGASLAAEIGSMKISEQLEALETLALDPIGFLVMPRVLAGVFMLPIITIFANFIAIFSVFFISSVVGDWISHPEFFNSLQINLRVFEFYYGNFIKPAVFGLLISLVGSHFGLKTRGGALGVGKASTNAVVVSAILIVFFDYYLARVLL